MAGRARSLLLLFEGQRRRSAAGACLTVLLVLFLEPTLGLGKRPTAEEPETAITIGEIRFEGNLVFAKSELLAALEWVRIGAAYQPKKLEQDLQSNLLSFYRNRGYLQARIDLPNAKIVRKSQRGRTGGDQNRYYSVTIPVEAGRQYRYRSFELKGVTVFKPESVNDIYQIQTGDVVNLGALLQAHDELQRLYFGWAYLDMKIMPRVDHDEAAGVLDLGVEVQEGRQYRVSSVEFNLNGKPAEHPDRNQSTERRISGDAQEPDPARLSPDVENAWLLKEKEPFNIELLELSLQRVNQLGHFEKIGKEGCRLIKDPGSAEVKIVVELKSKTSSQQ